MRAASAASADSFLLSSSVLIWPLTLFFFFLFLDAVIESDGLQLHIVCFHIVPIDHQPIATGTAQDPSKIAGPYCTV